MNYETHQQNEFGAASAPPTEAGMKSGTGIKEKVSRGAREAGDSARRVARDTASAVKNATTETAHQLRDQGKTFADSRRDELGGRIKGGGEAIRRAAEKLRDENDPNIARYADAIAERLERAGEYVRSRDFNAIYRDLESAARRRPELVFGGMFVAGLVIARFLKASSERTSVSRYDEEEDDYSAYDDTPEQSGWQESAAPMGASWEDAAAPVGTPKVSMADVPENKTQPAPVPVI